MNEMRPPTDNLYKFLAIFGLIVVVFSIYMPAQRLEAFSRSSMLVSTAYGPMFDRLNVVIDYSRAQLHCAISEVEKRTRQATEPSMCDDLPKKKAAADVANAELAKLRAQMEALEFERNFLYQQYVVYSVIGAVLGCIGLILCVAGFWLWYVRLQRFLDAAVRNEAYSAKQSLRRTWGGPKVRR